MTDRTTNHLKVSSQSTLLRLAQSSRHAASPSSRLFSIVGTDVFVSKGSQPTHSTMPKAADPRPSLHAYSRTASEIFSDDELEDTDLPPAEHKRPPPVAATDHRERLEWRSMLSSVLSGDILRGESSRIGLDKPGDVVFKKRIGQSLWWQIRARMRGRSEIEEKRRVDERRGRVVDAVLEEFEGFAVSSGDTLEQVAHMLQKLSLIEALYPTQAAFRAAKPLYDSSPMQTRIHALTAWYTIVTSLQAQLAVLQRWTGTDDLDILRPNTTKEEALTYHPLDTKAPLAKDDSTFLERISKEENIKKTFEKRVFSDLISLIHAAKATVIAYQPVFDEMNLPDFRTATVRLITFPGRLVMESLKSRLEKSVNLNDGTTLTAIVEALDGFRLTLSLAVLIKRQYEEIISPVAGWEIPDCLPSEYDQTLLDGIRRFFHVLHLRLKDGDRAIYFRETEILEDEWEFLGEVAEAVYGGDLVVAEQFWYVLNNDLAHAAL